jgi:polar amino acid transport system substrate-binding protein
LLISDERKQQVDFADPLARGGDGLVVAKDDVTQYLSVGDLRGQVIGTLAGSPYINLIQKAGSFPDLKLYPTALDVMKDVEAGRIKAGVVGGIERSLGNQAGEFPRLTTG